VSAAFYEKRLSTRERGEPESVAHLRAEAALLTWLGGRVTPRLLDTGEDERGPWLRTERVPFPTLAERLEDAARRGTKALERAWIETAMVSPFTTNGASFTSGEKSSLGAPLGAVAAA